jgi:hypothetical protein
MDAIKCGRFTGTACVMMWEAVFGHSIYPDGREMNAL